MTAMQYNDSIKHNDDIIFKPKDPISALTHFIGFLFAIIAMPILLIKASRYQVSLFPLIGLAVYMFTMILLYGASTAYHSFNLSGSKNRILKKVDHISIFYLIAGSYTPICISVLQGTTGMNLLVVIWGIAILGTIFKLFFVYCPKWVSSIIYTAMGWAALSVFPTLLTQMSTPAFVWLLMGGIFYTVGAIIYACKPKFFHNPYFGNHELFHCFVLVGSFCHFIVMYQYVSILI